MRMFTTKKVSDVYDEFTLCAHIDCILHIDIFVAVVVSFIWFIYVFVPLFVKWWGNRFYVR